MLHEKTLETYIWRLHDMIRKVEKYSSNWKTYEDFVSEESNIDMVIPPITQIWETASRISKLYPDVLQLPYSEIIGMRNILVHMYHNVDHQVLRKTVTVSIPKLKQILKDHNL